MWSPDYLRRFGTPYVLEDPFAHNCLSFSFRRAEPGGPFRRGGIDLALNVTGSIEANNGESLAQRTRAGVGVVRIGTFAVQGDLASGRPCRCWKTMIRRIANPRTSCSSAGRACLRVRPLVDFLVERLAGTRI